MATDRDSTETPDASDPALEMRSPALPLLWLLIPFLLAILWGIFGKN